jgi:hypothetical protein
VGWPIIPAAYIRKENIAIPLWFRWAGKDPLAKEAFASQLAFMRTVNVGYVPDAVRVDTDGKTKLTL